MQDGINRVRALLTKTTDLQQVILLESELTRRQADLDSLTQRLAQLDAMTTTSDVTVTLWTDATTPVQTESGLGGGLRTAWESLLGSAHRHPHRARGAPAVARPARAAHPAGPAAVASPQRRYAVRDLPHGTVTPRRRPTQRSLPEPAAASSPPDRSRGDSPPSGD